jgi:hypothetical protein
MSCKGKRAALLQLLRCVVRLWLCAHGLHWPCTDSARCPAPRRAQEIFAITNMRSREMDERLDAVHEFLTENRCAHALAAAGVHPGPETSRRPDIRKFPAGRKPGRPGFPARWRFEGRH